MIGDNAAIAEVGAHHHELHGTIAFAAWLGVHAWLLSGTRRAGRRLRVVGLGLLRLLPGQLAASSIPTRPASTGATTTTTTTRRPCQRGSPAPDRRSRRDRSDPMSEQFDVIIIGSGAGGGTLLHTLAPTGRRILLLERGDFLPREMENWDPGEVFVKGRYISPDTWYDADGKALPAPGPLLRRRGDEALRRGPLPPAPAGLRRAAPRRWHLARLAARATTTSSRGTRRPSGSTRCTATPARTPPRVTAPGRTPGRRSPTSRASSRSPTTLARRRLPPVPRAVRDPLDEADRARSTCIRCTWCDGYPCLVHAKADAETIAVRPVLDLPNVTLLVGAEVTRLRTDGAGRTVTERRRHRGTAARSATRATSSCVSAGAANTAKLLLMSANDRSPQRARQRLGPGRAQLRVPQQQGGGRARRRSRTRRSTRRRWASTTSTSGPTTTTGRSATSRWSASRTPRR